MACALSTSGQTFRYNTVRIGRGKHRKLVPTRPDLQEIDFVEVSKALNDAGWH